jgi:transcriptional regulator with XRE-family HTH domain
MNRKHTVLSSGSTSDYIKERLSTDKEGDFTRAFLKKGFLTAAMEALFYARRGAGLTQAQVAHRLQTKHTSIARWEGDTSGSISLHRYVEMALACGMIPLDIKLVPVKSLSEYVAEDPQAPRTVDYYETWLNKKFSPTFVAPSDMAVCYIIHAETSHIPLAHQAARGTIQFAEHLLKKHVAGQQTFMQAYSGNVTTATSGSQTDQLLQGPISVQTIA